MVYYKVMLVSVHFKLEFENNQEKGKVSALMRMQSPAIRFIYNRLVALVLPLLKRYFVRDFSPLKVVLIQGKRQRLARSLVPAFAGT